MRTTVPKLLIVLAFAAVMALWGPSPARAETDGLGGVEIVSAEELDAARGGYKAGTDLMFSFGIEKAVYVNGVLEATSSLNLLQAGGAGGQLSQVPFPGTLIQLGIPGDPSIGINSSAISPDSFRGIDPAEQPEQSVDHERHQDQRGVERPRGVPGKQPLRDPESATDPISPVACK